ncbi:hypothetical protein A2U01_0046482, partial [Trifolium medium]|nr:hypothetical protein [Trifolium medium]
GVRTGVGTLCNASVHCVPEFHKGLNERRGKVLQPEAWLRSWLACHGHARKNRRPRRALMCSPRLCLAGHDRGTLY